MRAYDNYDYEEEYSKRIIDLEEWRLENLIRTEKVKCLYRTTTTRSKNIKSGREILEAQVYPSFKNFKDVPVTTKKRETKPSQRNLNHKNSRRYLIRLVNINFGEGDYWCTFGWNTDQLPETMEQAQKDVANFIKRIKYRHKKVSTEEVKYIYVLAFDGYERPHFHLILSCALNRDVIEDAWGKCDRPNTRRVKPDDAILTGMATYVGRNPHGAKSWCPSKNLKKPPEPSRSYSKFKRRRVREMVQDYEKLRVELEKSYPGYKYLDAEIYHNGINDGIYIYARMVRN
ncbi:hypothetical protein LJC51_07440 [Lachnospiraceae bacterium OttesenSCG-928-J05]|nr:hypothetical protein [Lachnospiraceae bacterium OttesenSCG-928-J05]